MPDDYELVKADFYEALASYTLLRTFDLDEIGHQNKPVATFINFTNGALGIRMALAVHRLVQRQGKSGDRASLFTLVNDYGGNNSVKDKLTKIETDPFFKKLNDVRNGFLGHTLKGEFGKRNGFKLSDLDEFFLSKIIPAVEAIFKVANVEWNGVDSYSFQWQEISKAMAEEFKKYGN